MKRIFVILLTVMAMSICVLAEETFTLTEYLGLTDASDYIEKVEFIIPDESTQKRHEIPKEDFLSLAETIILTDVEGSPMFTDGDGKPSVEWNGIYIEVRLDESKAEESEDFERFKFAFVSVSGGVDRYSMMFSRLPYKDCVMRDADVEKLYGLAGFTELPKLEFDETPVEVIDAEAATELSDQNAAAEEQASNSGTDEYNGAALVIVVAVMIAAVAVTLKLTGKKEK